MTPTRAFIVAPTPMIRAGLRSMLATVEGTDVQVVGEVASLTEPGVASALSEADVVLVADEESLEETSLAVAEEGTQGLVSPDAPPEELVAAIAAVAQGLTVMPRPLTERLLPAPADVEELSEPLTSREHEVLELLGRGLSNKLIAQELYISEHTVKFHVSSLYTKLGVNSRAEAVSQGARHGLISL